MEMKMKLTTKVSTSSTRIDTPPKDAVHSSSMSDIALLRLVLARELETINEYEQFSRDAESESLRIFFAHLAKEEKEHVSEAMALIHQLDQEQADEWAEVNVSEDHFVRGRITKTETETPKPEPAPRAPRRSHSGFTVGSLKRTD